jgi:hypothetical protein
MLSGSICALYRVGLVVSVLVWVCSSGQNLISSLPPKIQYFSHPMIPDVNMYLLLTHTFCHFTPPPCTYLSIFVYISLLLSISLFFSSFSLPKYRYLLFVIFPPAAFSLLGGMRGGGGGIFSKTFIPGLLS